AEPPLADAGSGRLTACVRLNDIRSEMLEMREAAKVRGRTIMETPVERESPLVRIDQLSKVFRDRSGRDVQALSDVSIEIGRDESVGLVGESGSGKTTLGRCLVGLERPTVGRVYIDGMDVSGLGQLSRDDRR